jgi:hypothetical protein
VHLLRTRPLEGRVLFSTLGGGRIGD